MMSRSNRTGSRWRAWLVLLGLAVWLAGCSLEPTPPATPDIVSFVAVPATIEAGGSSELQWEVEGATSVVVTAGGSTVVDSTEAMGSQSVSPSETTSYTLTATAGSQSATASVTVTVTTSEPQPEIVSFVAVPATIEAGGSSELQWEVEGATSVVVTAGGSAVVDSTEAMGSQSVSPSETTSYTLTATAGSQSATASVTVTVTPATGAPAISAFDAEVVMGSRVAFTWSATGADEFDLLAVADGDPSDAEVLASGVTATTITLPIPASARQRVRLVAKGSQGPDDSAEVLLTNVVTSSGDYDPYDASGGVWIEPEVPGTLRSVLKNAAPGSVVGFAADVTQVTLYGVDLEEGPSFRYDAHLVVRSDVVVSGPDGRVVIQGTSGWEDGDPGDPFTYRSRVLLVNSDVAVTLHNLELTGGTFIFSGGAVMNQGTLTIEASEIYGNRAWYRGGAIWNTSTGVLTIVDSAIDGNVAATEDDEVGLTYFIRGGGDTAVISDGGSGGAIFNDEGGVVTLVDSRLELNAAKFSGGGIYNDSGGSVTLTGTDLVGNRADHNAYAVFVLGRTSYGGGVFNWGGLDISDGDLLENVVADQGGGLFHHEDSLATLVNVDVLDNVAGTGATEGYGGGVMHRYYAGEEANLSRTGVLIAGNTPDDYYDRDLGVRPLGIVPLDVDGGPTPGLFYLPPGADPDARTR
jgi:hypothetical protein